MDRETITIETPSGKHKIVLKAWITGREKRELRKPFLNEVKINVGQETAQVSEFNAGEIVEQVENKAIEIIVVSVDGQTENKLDLILDMKDEDYDFVVAEINKISQEVNFPKPKQKA